MLAALPCLAAACGGHRSGRPATTTFAPPPAAAPYRLSGLQPKHLHPPEPTPPTH